MLHQELCYTGSVDAAALLTSFGLIFVAELPDKTAYTILLLAARGRTLPVLLGAWSAFLVQGFIAVGLGSLLMRLPPQAVRWTVAGIFAAFGLVLLLRAEQDGAPPAPDTHDIVETELHDLPNARTEELEAANSPT